MNCTYCGAALAEGARFCGACGRLLAPAGTGGTGRTGGTGGSGRTAAPPGAEGESGGVLRSNVAEFDATAHPRYGPLLVEAPRPTVTGAYEHAWRQLKRFFLHLFVVGLVYALIQIPLSLVDLALEEQPVVRLLYQLLSGLLVAAPMGVGLAFAFLRAARGEQPEVGDVFAPYRRAFLPSIAATVLYGVCVGVGLVLLIVPGIIVGIRLSFFPYLVVDEGYGPVQALRESWERTRGYGWTILGVSLLAIPIAILGLIALVVGIIPAILLVQLAEASVFVGISARGGAET